MKMTTLVSVCMIFCILLTACANAVPTSNAEAVTPTTPAPLKMKVCYSTQAPTQASVWYAFEKGLFKKYGLDVDLTLISPGTTAGIALISKDVDICVISSSPIASAAVQGQDTIIIAGFYKDYLNSFYVNPQIKTAADLKGKTLGVSKLGSASDLALRVAVRKLGLDPEKDVDIIAVGDETARLAAMDTGQVAGSVFDIPSTLRAKEKGYFAILDLSTADIRYQTTVVGTTRSYIQSNHEAGIRFMKAIIESISLMKKDPEGTKIVMAKYLALDVNTDAALLKEAYHETILKHIELVPEPNIEGLQAVLNELKNSNPKASEFKPEQFIDASLLQELDQSGFISEITK